MIFLIHEHPISSTLAMIIAHLKETLGRSDDVIIREFEIGFDEPLKAAICFIEHLVNTDMINQHIVGNLLSIPDSFRLRPNESGDGRLTAIQNRILSLSQAAVIQTMNEAFDGILSGETVLFVDGYGSAISIASKEYESRSVEEPKTEAVTRGPREGFTEDLPVNISLIRRRIKNAKLIFENTKVGTQTRTTVCIAYIEGMAERQLVQEVKNRLNRIDAASVLDSGQVEQWIEDHPFSFLASIGNSEKPDIVAAKILEGRVAILCEGSPTALTLPHLFIENLQNSEDYYSRVLIATFSRLLRIFAFFVSTATPALYVALTTFHQEMIPTVLLVTMAASREGTPFPAFVETLLMGITFELLTEAGVRMPRPIGQTISIVGALVLGQAAVEAGIVSSPMIIVTALTGISSLIVPSLRSVTILFRIILIFLAGSFGGFGILIGFILMLAHMCSLRSFGVMYMAPIAPIIWADLKDSLIRMPIQLLQKRPKSITRRPRTTK
ncbi:spore germination protein [Paenibacillus sp. A3]|uniref:spore germination protein n=1 Tax=Paenibacillus sp. A3 TaxID=1337054 RepID=UPI0006D5A4B7|nr:spore germination protein [Paenibacillus sp. A3]